MAQILDNDALGGAGSIKADLRTLAVQGLSRAIDGRLAARYGLTTFNETQTETGQPAGAPQNSSASDKVTGVFSNPIAIAIGAAVALSVLIVFAVRK